MVCVQNGVVQVSVTFAFCPQPLSRMGYQLKLTAEEDAELGSIILMYFIVCLEVFWKLCKVPTTLNFK